MLKEEKMTSILALVLAETLASMTFLLLMTSIMSQKVPEPPILSSPFHKLSFDTHQAYDPTAEKMASILASIVSLHVFSMFIALLIVYGPLMNLHQCFPTQ